MHTITTMALACALAAVGERETVLLNFHAPWCGACRQVAPVVERLAGQGLPIRAIDVDQQPELAARYQIEQLPCFVLLVDGREVEREIGAISAERLVALCHAGTASRRVGQALAEARADQAPLVPLVRDRKTTFATNVAAAPAAPSNREGAWADDCLASSVRLTIADPRGRSHATGTIIDARAGEALVLTCGHVFRDSAGQGSISIDLFGDGALCDLPGKLLRYDLDRDVALVAFRPPVEVRAAPLAAATFQARSGDPVLSVGCDHGAEPTALESRVTTVDKFVGPPNLQVAGQPVEGRSGGGLFAADGRVIGVCNAADPRDDEGLYAAVGSIHAVVADAGLTELLAQATSSPRASAALLDPGAPRGGFLPTLPAMPASFAQAAPGASAPPSGAGLWDEAPRTAGADAHASQPQRRPDHVVMTSAGPTEVICIVRDGRNPHGASEVFVVNEPTPALLEQLGAAKRAAGAGRSALVEKPSEHLEATHRP